MAIPNVIQDEVMRWDVPISKEGSRIQQERQYEDQHRSEPCKQKRMVWKKDMSKMRCAADVVHRGRFFVLPKRNTTPMLSRQLGELSHN